MANSLTAEMRRYVASGVSVIPIDPRTKRPAADLLPVGDEGKHVWGPFAQSLPGESWVRKWEAANVESFASVCGNVSGGREVLDFDVERFYSAWRDRVGELAEGLPTQRTGGGGYQMAWRCPQPASNTALAWMPDDTKESGRTIAIETRGEGGYAVMPLSLHPSGQRYEALQGDMANPPIISQARRDALIAAAVALDEAPKTRQQMQADEARGKRPESRRGEANGQVNVIAEFNKARPIEGELEAHGYTRVGPRYARPGRDVGSVTVRDGQTFHHSTNDPLNDGYWHDAFDVFCYYEHNGEVKAAVRAAAAALGIARPAPTTSNGKTESPPAGAPTQADTTTEATPAPSVYFLQNGVTCYQTTNKRTGEITTHPVAHFDARISEYVTYEDGPKLYRLTGRAVRGGDFTAEITAEDFADDRRLKATLQAAAGPYDPVWAGMAKHLGPAIMSRTNGDLRHIRAYQRTGWAEQSFLIPGREPAGATISLPHNLPYGIQTDASLDQGLDALEALLDALSSRLTTVVLSTMFQAPLAHLAGWRGERYGLFIAGRTGSLKSSYAQTAMCLYGPGFARDELLIKWGEGATRNAIMALATRAHDLPLLIDNYKPNTGGGARDFTNLIHNILEGGEKARLDRAANLRESRPVYCWPVVTGEDVPDRDPASLARILVVPFAWPQGKTNERLGAAQASAGHLCAVGSTWLGWLESDDGQELAQRASREFQALRGKWATILNKHRSDMVNVLRVASNLASNQLTWSVLTHHPALGPLAKRYQAAHIEGLKDIASGMATYTAEALEATRLLDALRELLTSERCLLLSRGCAPSDHQQDRVIGWQDDKGVYLIFDTAKDAALRVLGRDGLNNLSNQALFSQLDGLGLIAQKGSDGKTCRQVKVYTDRNVRVLHLRPEAFDQAEDAEE